MYYKFAAPTAESLFLPVSAILAMESADSIRSLYRHFLSGITAKSQNAFYYACSYAKVDCSVFMNVTAKPALRLVPTDLRAQLLFLCIDDTMVSKSGKKFEDVSKLFDHAAHNGANYLNGIFWAREVMAYVTSTGKENGTRRLFFSTIFSAQLQIFCAWQEKALPNQTGSGYHSTGAAEYRSSGLPSVSR